MSGLGGISPEPSAVPATGFAVGRGVAGDAGATYSDERVAGESAGESLCFADSCAGAAGAVGEVALLLVSDSGLDGCCGDFGS